MQSLFHTYITAGVEASLSRVQAAEHIVPEADRQQAWHILSFALNVPAAWPVTRDLLLALAPKMEQAGFREEWLPYLEKGLHCAQRMGDDRAAAECELQIGLLYRLMSRFEEARQWTAASVDHFAAQGQAHGQARALNELAWLDHLQRHYEAATHHVEQALTQLAPDDPECAVSFRVKGMIAMGQRQWQQAEHLQRKALTLFQQSTDLRRMAWSQQNIGYALSEQEKLEEAIDLYQQAAATLQQLGDRYHWAIVQMNLGVVYYRLQQPEQALACHLAAAEIFSMVDDHLHQAAVATNLGLTYLALQAYTQSYRAFHVALDLYTRLDDEIWYINAMDGLAMALIADEQYEAAIVTLNEALVRLPNIQDSAYYDNLSTKLTTHLQQAQQAQERMTVHSPPVP